MSKHAVGPKGLLVFATSMFLRPATAQLGWLPVPSSGLNSRIFHAMAYDPIGRRALVLGGQNNSSYDTGFASWDGRSWTPIGPGAPEGRYLHAMVFDAARSRLVVFGGTDSTSYTYLGDLWEWDGFNWAQFQVPGPIARHRHAMAYDPIRQRVVLFGGDSQVGLLGDTWEWDGVAWVPKFSPSNPSRRAGAAMTYDPSRGAVVLFGGSVATSPALSNETWAWNGVVWQRIVVPSSPSPREAASLVYDPRWGCCVLFGGQTSGSVASDISLLRGSSWTLLGTYSLPGVSSGPYGTMVHDAAREQIVFTGGYGSFTTWVFDGNPSAVGSFGMGCGSQPASLQTVPFAPPVIGRTAQLSMQGAALDFGFLAIGTSKFWMGGFPLPIALDGLGMPGCGILQSNDIHSSYPSSSGSAGIANFTLPIPPNVFFLGVELHLQAWAPDPAANTAGIVLTNGLTWTIGDY
jgi:hypothetical protein